MQQRTVVTGGGGFLGSHLCTALIERGATVICLDNFVTSTPDNLAHLRARPGFSLRHCDVSTGMHIDGPVDLVVHLACPASPNDYLRLPVETMKVGSAGTMNALELARDKDARFVLASTSEVYGDPLQHPQREDYWGNVNPLGPRSVYDESKRFSEALTCAYRRRHQVNAGIVRIFNSYGPRMRPYDGRAIPTFIHQAMTGKPITVAGDGSQTRSLCFVDDTVQGILALADSEHPGPVNIGSTSEITILELAERIRAATDSDSEIEFVDLPENDPHVRRPDTTLARDLFGWEPRVSLPDGLARTTAWFSRSLTGTNGHRAQAGAPGTRLRAAEITSST